MVSKNKKTSYSDTTTGIEKRRKQMEGVATFGLLLIAVAMLGPFMSLTKGASTVVALDPYKWIYAAGALVYTFARLVNVSDPADSLRLRRLRRLEFWAGIAFCIGAFFWFYNASKFSQMTYVGPLALLRDTVIFSLAGAAIQTIAAWAIAWRQKKERKA